MPTCAELAKELQALRQEVAELEASLVMFNDLCERVKNDNEALTKANKVLRDENIKLSKQMCDLEQYSRLNNVELKGIPETKGEDCLAVKDIGEKIGCPVADTDIDTAHRVPAKNGSNIIARFCSRNKKAEFAKKARKARLSAADIGFPHSTGPKPVYVDGGHVRCVERVLCRISDGDISDEEVATSGHRKFEVAVHHGVTKQAADACAEVKAQVIPGVREAH
ncbi:hypothetical protein HPB50_007316 [Hyalomma asiaticum]|uniref:Uncharacterized protein n=1 Tax=Hyalomma asiaticum TaxID=266040 RepID=A0ACB7STW5_HYAAI|nr:hypothetical protein HPB50_007316 [Hyalomma asiaticum]